MNKNKEIFSVSIFNDKDRILLNNSDIKTCYFIEDIYSFVKTGKIVFIDSIGIVEFLPLVGGEKITIEYSSEGESKEYEFVIYKISKIEEDISTKRKYIELLFVESIHYALHTYNHSLSFKENSKYSDIIKHISSNHLGINDFVKWENSKETLLNFYTGLKTPASNLKWLMNRCSGKDSNEPGYLFYSNTFKTERSFNFVTLETLLKNTKLIGLYTDQYTFQNTNEYYINNIISYKINMVDNASLNSLSNNIYLGYDIHRKKIIRREYNYNDSLKHFTVLGKFSLFDKNKIKLSTLRQTLTGDCHGENTETILDNLYFSNWIKQYCLQQTIDIIVKGHNKRYAGGMIEIIWPSGNKDSTNNKNMMGKYLIKSITHMFTTQEAEQYLQKIILIKNGYQDTDSNYLVEIDTSKRNM